MDLGFQLDLDVEVDVQSESQLLILALLFLSTSQDTAESFARTVRHAPYSFARSVLDEIRGTTQGVTNLVNTTQWTKLTTLLLLALTTLRALTSSTGLHVATIYFFCVFGVLVPLYSLIRTTSSIASSRLGLWLWLRLVVRFFDFSGYT
jgi:hypothetical protein